MSAIEFTNAFFRDGQPAMTLEDGIRRCGAFAGIHDWDFLNAVSDQFADLNDWTGDGAASWAAAGGQMQGTGGGGSLWYQLRHDVKVAPSLVITVTRISGDGAIVCRGKTGAKDALIGWWTSSTCGFSLVSSTGAETKLVSMPFGIDGIARLTLTARWQLDSVYTEKRWLNVSLFADGECLVGAAILESDVDWTGNAVGLAVYGSNTLIADDFHVPDLHRVVEWCSIDPGEAAATGMGRAIGSTRVVYMARFDGTVRVWRPGNRSVDWAVPDHYPIKVTDRSNRTSALTRIRTMGAMSQVDTFDDGEGDTHMHRFQVINDPNAEDDFDAYAAGWRALHDAKEGQEVTFLEMPPNPLLEVHDRVTFDTGDWRVLGLDRSYVMARGPQIKMKVEARRYLEQTNAPDRT